MQQPPRVFLGKREVTEMIKTCSSIERIWGGVKVCEARKPLRVFLLPTDIKGAESHDPTNCAFARAVRRMCGGRAVFLRRTAYIELMQPNGEKRVERFMMPENMRAIVEAFDKRGECPPGGFMLIPPAPSEKLEAKRKRERMHHKALVKGTARTVKGTPRAGTYAKPVEILVNGVRIRDGYRYGTGLVQFHNDEA
jgi:hypothetical protein